ncbi:MAG: LruC domain-containing protein [Leptospira sp.]|nr:LruC domain-containing protein [Leptospira sp.]
MKSLIAKSLILSTIFIGTFACSNSEDDDLVWLLSVLNQPEGENTVAGGSESNSSNSAENDASEESRPFSIVVNDVIGTPDFIFENTTEYPLRIQIRDPFDPVSGAMVQIRELNPNGVQSVIFRAISGEDGNISGTFTIPNREEAFVLLEIYYLGEEYFFEINLRDVIAVNRDIFIFLENITQVDNPDRDGDGIPDHLDDYPDDPTRATKVRIPSEMYYTVAYEDLYPQQGDADFNDYVVRVVNEEDLDAKGEVVRIRGFYTHVAKGAGYNHTLHLRIPGEVSGEYSLVRKRPDGSVYFNESGNLNSGGSIMLLPESNTTISQSNTDPGQVLSIGDSSEYELILSGSVSRNNLIKAPYDLYVHVSNTKKDIHFLGLYKNPDGSDKYLDPNGFPWALLVPGDFHWPLEKKNIHDGYPKFFNWYSSNGVEASNWYETTNPAFLFSY